MGLWLRSLPNNLFNPAASPRNLCLNFFSFQQHPDRPGKRKGLAWRIAGIVA
jgi:hypothetical protein